MRTPKTDQTGMICYPKTANDSLDLSGSLLRVWILDRQTHKHVDVFHICPESPMTSHHPITPLGSFGRPSESNIVPLAHHQPPRRSCWNLVGPKPTWRQCVPWIARGRHPVRKGTGQIYLERCWETLRCCMGIVYQLLDSWSPFWRPENVRVMGLQLLSNVRFMRTSAADAWHGFNPHNGSESEDYIFIYRYIYSFIHFFNIHLFIIIFVFSNRRIIVVKKCQQFSVTNRNRIIVIIINGWPKNKCYNML